MAGTRQQQGRRKGFGRGSPGRNARRDRNERDDIYTREFESPQARELAIQEKIRESWKPKTEIGRKVKQGEIVDLGDLLDRGGIISEEQIIDYLFTNLSSDLLLIGQAKGKFGGGQRRIFRQTQKKTKDGNTISFVCAAASGVGDGYVGLGFGKSKETVPAKDKAIRSSKLGMIKIRRGCGSWECNCGGDHSIPYAVHGKCGSVRVTLLPAPKGKGLVANAECRKIIGLAGIKDVFSHIEGPTKCRLNVVKACFEALKQLTRIKVQQKDASRFVDGQLQGS